MANDNEEFALGGDANAEYAKSVAPQICQTVSDKLTGQEQY